MKTEKPATENRQYRIETQCVHEGYAFTDSPYNAGNPPLELTVTYGLGESPYKYSRFNTPNRDQLARKLAAMEHGTHALITATGQAALSLAMLTILRPGDRVILAPGGFGGTFDLLCRRFAPMGVHITLTRDCTPEAFEEAFEKAGTKLTILETPSNPLLRITDLFAVSTIAHQYKVFVLVDNTFATPLRQLPLDLGCDAVFHSCSKFLNGSGTGSAGALILKDVCPSFQETQALYGMVPGNLDVLMTWHGISTLPARLQAQEKSASTIAMYLAKHPKVDAVYYPGLETHPDYELARSQMRGSGAMLSFTLKDANAEETLAVMRRLKLITPGFSLGEIKSLCSHCASMSHGSVPEKLRKAAGIGDNLLRLSIGLEHIDDLLEDLDEALR